MERYEQMISDETRQAALFLHSQAREDQEWLLSQLPQKHRNNLRTLLDELKTLGMPIGLAEPVQKKIEINRLDQISGVDKPEESATVYLEKSPLGLIIKALQHEHLETIAFFLQSHPWPWKIDFIEKFDPSRRFQLREKLKPNFDESTHSSLPNSKKLNDSLIVVMSKIVREIELTERSENQTSCYKNEESQGSFSERINQGLRYVGLKWSLR